MLGLVRDRSDTKYISMVHNPKGCYKKTTKTLFFKHLYLICTLFYNTLSYSYVLHSTYVPCSCLRPTQIIHLLIVRQLEIGIVMV